MSSPNGITRRQVIGMSAAASSLLCPAGFAVADTLRRTPVQVLGPFYPVIKPADQDPDLTRIAGKSGRALGQVIHIMGRVVNRHGEPIAGARMEVWQANTHGRYRHSSDVNPAPLDPNFEGYAVLTTADDGGFRFTTIKPGAYPAGPNSMRPPHIHFDIMGKRNRLTTQMYFAGEPLNENDRFLSQAGEHAQQLIVSLQPAGADFESGTLLGHWDVVLEEG
jgi:protocatechuate 3,4-dioxygenase beta subunit